MIEQIIRDYLLTKLTVPVYLELPANKPETYVVIEKTGSGLTNHIKRATFALQSYATSMYEAASLNEQVKVAMDGAVELDEIARSHLESDYNYTDTQTKQYRYQAVYELIHY